MQTPRTLSTFFACLLVTLPLFAAGQSSEPLPVPNDSLKQKAHDHGLDFSLIYKAEVGRILGGGKSPGTSYLENLDLKLEIDGEKLFGQPQFSAFIYGIGDKGSESGNVPTVFVGDAQGASNIETAVDDFKLYEAWIQWSFWYKKISLLAGLHDLNSEFYVTESSTPFLNSSFGVGRDLS